MSTPTYASLMLLADARFPAGGHAHSNGVEAAIAIGAVRDIATLTGYVRGRLNTTAFVDAAFTASAVANPQRWTALDDELEARVVSPRQRMVSRSLGRQLLRAGLRVWPHPALRRWPADAPPPHQAIALGGVAFAAGLTARDAAACGLHQFVASAVGAAVRLLGLDPFDATAAIASSAHDRDELAATAAELAGGPLDQLPAAAGPLSELLAEDHATWEVRLFAS